MSNLWAFPVARRVCKTSLPVKLVCKSRRTLFWKTVLLSALSSLPKVSVRAKIASPTSLVVVENWLASNSAVRASNASTRPRKVASSAENSSCNRCKVAKSSLVTNSAVAVAINSLTRSKQAFKPAANS